MPFVHPVALCRQKCRSADEGDVLCGHANDRFEKTTGESRYHLQKTIAPMKFDWY